ncbi:MAG: sensor histidine kinase [Pirellulales bacterium]
MNTTVPPASPLETAPEVGADLQTVLAAWNAATLRLEETHEALRNEVCRLTDELEIKNRELARKNRLADLGQMAAHVAHEVRNNLVPVTLYLSLLRRRVSDDPGAMDILAKVESGFVALDATVNDLLHFAAQRDPRLEPVRLHAIVEEIHAFLGPQLLAQDIRTANDVPPQQVVMADRDMLRRAVLNLTLNAVDAMPEGGELVVTSYSGAEGVELEIADSGPGLSDEVRKRMFEPFFTTKSGGTGLGLAIVDRIAAVHGGSVTAVNCPERGAAFTLRLPHPVPQYARKAAA